MSKLKHNVEKIWEKGIPVDALIEKFTIGKDRELDLVLTPFDVLGSMAHVKMLHSIQLIDDDELPEILNELTKIYHLAVSGQFQIEEGIEDVHSQVELMLTRALGDMGKKIHSGRSRNDQVLLDLKLYARNEIKEITGLSEKLFSLLIRRSNQSKDVLIPGYTHLQVAMPSSFGLWFGAYAESLTDDLQLLNAAWKITNQNPLGSAAGYGSSFPLNRQMTTDLLGFDNMNYNVVYAQMGRGKVEKTIAFALSSIASTLSKLAFDVCMFTSQNFGFVKLPDNMTTGSSIMPHKKNPDVFELLRAHCNKIQALPNDIVLMTNNLPSGYFRDLQIIKEVFIPAFDELKSCLQIAAYAIENMTLNENVLDDKKYDLIFSVEDVNKLASSGVPFRDAYKQVARKILDGEYVPQKNVHHTHEGSIGNLCNDMITEKMNSIVDLFDFEKIDTCYSKLLSK
ncbi:MAG: argininosuccinate lyase [Prolixibacteraceae bacterium]|nr:argininosuccinate lyase [Prolixibacteraceae bacterium]MBN2649969.1 argininosuccinate lyase [Prolixibacteraceae bacterium]